MTLGINGLGRMGANMTERLVRGGHRVVGFAPKQETRERVGAKGAESAARWMQPVTMMFSLFGSMVGGPMIAQLERMGPWAITPCCPRLRQVTRQASALVKNNP